MQLTRGSVRPNGRSVFVHAQAARLEGMKPNAVPATLRLLAELVGSVLLTLLILMVVGVGVAWGVAHWH